MMKLDSVGDRMIIYDIYYIVNTFIGIPILAFCLLIVTFYQLCPFMSLIATICFSCSFITRHRKVIEKLGNTMD